MTRIGLAVVVLTVAVGGCGKKEEAANTAASAAAPSASVMPLAPTSASADAPFEGEIVVSVKDEAGQKLPASITYDIKGDRVRYVATSTNIRAIGDMTAQHAYAIDDAQKSYRDLDTKTAAAPGKAPVEAPVVGKTGKMEKIAGTTCENWTISASDGKVDVCAVKGIAFFDFAREPKPGNVEPSWAAALTKEKAFPLRVVVHDKGGKEQFRTEATTVVRKKLDDVLFQPPTGFKKTELDVKSASLP